MARSKLSITKNGANGYHIEAPGCIINITTDLTNREGQAVTHISIQADQYAGEPFWRVVPGSDTDSKGLGVRVIQDLPTREGDTND